MSLLYPTAMFERITELTPDILRELGVDALMLDVDNTLTTHNNPNLEPEVLAWLEVMREAEIPLIIISNNSRKRVEPFARALGLDYIACAMKPLPFGYWRAAEHLGKSGWQTAVVGDQIFTDILGGRLCGVQAILLAPIEPEDGAFFRFKRKIEVVILRHYRKKISRSVVRRD